MYIIRIRKPVSTCTRHAIINYIFWRDTFPGIYQSLSPPFSFFFFFSLPSLSIATPFHRGWNFVVIESLVVARQRVSALQGFRDCSYQAGLEIIKRNGGYHFLTPSPSLVSKARDARWRGTEATVILRRMWSLWRFYQGPLPASLSFTFNPPVARRFLLPPLRVPRDKTIMKEARVI